jgi:transcriptional regulator with XRE-family HTH domain
MNKDERISLNIKKYRDKLGISELDMATEMGLPFTFYRLFELTASKFDVAMLSKAAGILGCSIEELEDSNEE